MLLNKNPFKILSRTILYTILLSIVLWVIAASIPAYVAVPPAKTTMLGIMCFLWGPLALLFGPLYGLIWGANILGLIGLWMLKRRSYLNAVLFSLVAFALSAVSLLIRGFPRDENGGFDKATPALGAYLWILSMLVIFIGSYVALRMSRKLPPQPGIEQLKIAAALSPVVVAPKNDIPVGRILLIAVAILISAPVLTGIVLGVIKVITTAR